MTQLKRLIAWLAADPVHAGLYLDFDGTLAPIVTEPARSRLAAGLEDVLAGLAQQLGLVALVSGRPAAFLAERASIPGVLLIGLYGLEEWRDGSPRVRPEAGAWRQAVAEAREVLAGRFSAFEGVHVEDKGLAVAVHWRNAADHVTAEAAVTAIVTELAAQTGLALVSGKLVWELRPPVSWDKGSVVTSTARELGLERVVYVGDDFGDLPAFAAARELGGRAVAVDYGVETPPEVLAAADLRLDGAQQVADLLTDLATALQPECER